MDAPYTEAETAALMDRYGIVRVPADQFHCNGWRYSNLRDAIAEARRAQRKNANGGGGKDAGRPALSSRLLKGLLLPESKG